MRRFFGGGGKFKKNDVVKLKEGAPFESPKPGSVGIIANTQRGDEPSYEVEFINSRGAVTERLVVKEVYLSPMEG